METRFLHLKSSFKRQKARLVITENGKWAVTFDFQQCGILTSVDSDEHVQPPFKFRNSKWCSVSSLTLIKYSSDQQRLWSDCAYAQADPRLCWLHIPHCWKSHVEAQIIFWSCSWGYGTILKFLIQFITCLKIWYYQTHATLNKVPDFTQYESQSIRLHLFEIQMTFERMWTYWSKFRVNL